jgi:hypothetical protein
MLECIRVLVNTPGWSPSHSIIFRTSRLFPSLLLNISASDLSSDDSIQQRGRIITRRLTSILDAASDRIDVSTLPFYGLLFSF